MKHGHYYTGIFKGIKSYPKTNRNTGETKQVHILGLSSPVTNGFANEERIFEVELGKKAVAAGLQNQFEDFEDKLITLPIYQSHWVYKDEVKTKTYYGSLTILDVTVLDQPIKKVG